MHFSIYIGLFALPALRIILRNSVKEHISRHPLSIDSRELRLSYTIEYLFYLNGILKVKVRALGFIFGAFYIADNTKSEDEYSHRIYNALSSSMHDHVLNFKANMDVAEPTNDIIRLALEPLTAFYPWDTPQVKERNTMHLVKYAVTEETALDWPKNLGEFYVVCNIDGPNSSLKFDNFVTCSKLLCRA